MSEGTYVTTIHLFAKIIVLVVLIVTCLLTGYYAIKAVGESGPKTVSSDCWSISSDQSTGTIRCWSGGVLVYDMPIYHNGGVLCSTDGAEIDIVGKSSICVIESKQGNVWIPPGR